MTDSLTPLLTAFELSLKARRRSPATVRGYMEAARLFIADQRHRGRPLDAEAVTRGDVERFIVGQLETHKPTTAATRYRSLQQFWRWLVIEGELDASPMDNTAPPKIEPPVVPVIGDDEIKKLLATTKGKGFDNRRDAAILRTFFATGVRLGEMASMRVDGLDLEGAAVLVTGKGDRERWVTFGARTGEALSWYTVERARHRLHARPELWLGRNGPMGESGIAQVVKRRSRQAGIEGLNPHRFRHTFAHRWLAAGGTEGDLQELAGWRSPQMLARYGASARSERARAAYRRIDVEGEL